MTHCREYKKLEKTERMLLVSGISGSRCLHYRDIGKMVPSLQGYREDGIFITGYGEDGTFITGYRKMGTFITGI